MADDKASLAKIEFNIIRYRNGKGSFTSLVSGLDGLTGRLDSHASYRVELRSRWMDLDDLRRRVQADKQTEPTGEHRRQTDMVLDELIEITRRSR